MTENPEQTTQPAAVGARNIGEEIDQQMHEARKNQGSGSGNRPPEHSKNYSEFLRNPSGAPGFGGTGTLSGPR